MTLEFSEVIEMRESPLYRVHVAAHWYQQEIERAKTIANVDSSEKAAGLLSMLTDFALGTYTSKWFDPGMHAVLTRKAESQTGQIFVFGRLRLLAMIPEFSRENSEELLEMLGSGFITPERVMENTVHLNEVFIESFRPNEAYLKTFFKENHWLLLLLFIVSSYQLLGYENKLLTAD